MEEQQTENKPEPVQTSHAENTSNVHTTPTPHHTRNEPKAQAKAPSQQKTDNFWKISTVVLVVVLAFFAFKGGDITGGTVVDNGVAPTNNGGGAVAPTVDMKGLIGPNDHVKGDANAPVTIVEWSDFECPFCARFYSDTLNQIEEEYIKTGKVKLVYKDFPLSFHPQAQKAAEAAECAGDQGKYWEMHDLLFDNGVQGGVASFKENAKTLGLNTGEFNSCLDSGEKASGVQADMALGGQSGIQGTPGFIINGQLVSGAQPFTVFKQIIDAELS
jgi:protein-disulfide isomerase